MICLVSHGKGSPPTLPPSAAPVRSWTGHSVGPTSVFELAQSPVLGPGFKQNTPFVMYPHLHSWVEEKVPLKQKPLQRSQHLSFSVASALRLSVQAMCCGYLVWHQDHVHIPAQPYILQMKHKAPWPVFKPDIRGHVESKNTRDSRRSPVGMFVVLSVVPESMNMDGISKQERQEGKVKWCTLLWWKVLELELIRVWLAGASCRFGFREKAWLAFRGNTHAESAEGILRSLSSFTVLFP